jgi:hypothetical protein
MADQENFYEIGKLPKGCMVRVLESGKHGVTTGPMPETNNELFGLKLRDGYICQLPPYLVVQLLAWPVPVAETPQGPKPGATVKLTGTPLPDGVYQFDGQSWFKIG